MAVLATLALAATAASPARPRGCRLPAGSVRAVASRARGCFAAARHPRPRSARGSFGPQRVRAPGHRHLAARRYPERQQRQRRLRHRSPFADRPLAAPHHHTGTSGPAHRPPGRVHGCSRRGRRRFALRRHRRDQRGRSGSPPAHETAKRRPSRFTGSTAKRCRSRSASPGDCSRTLAVRSARIAVEPVGRAWCSGCSRRHRTDRGHGSSCASCVATTPSSTTHDAGTVVPRRPACVPDPLEGPSRRRHLPGAGHDPSPGGSDHPGQTRASPSPGREPSSYRDGTAAAAQQHAATGIPGWVWIALAIAAVLLIVVPLFVWKHARARPEHSGRGELSIPVRRRAVLIVVAVVSPWEHTPEGPSGARTSAGRAGRRRGLCRRGGSTVTSAGVSAVAGDLGVSPGTAITGFPPGSAHRGPAPLRPARQQAHADWPPPTRMPPGAPGEPPISTDFGGLTLTQGCMQPGAAITWRGRATLTLDAQGNPNAVFIIQAGSTFTTGAVSQVDLTGGAQACNVFWQVGSSATLGAPLTAHGNAPGLHLDQDGRRRDNQLRALARDAAVTLINDTSLPRSARRRCRTPRLLSRRSP